MSPARGHDVYPEDAIHHHGDVLEAPPKSLLQYPPGMLATEVEAAIGVSEHGRRELERSGVLVPIKIGRRKVYPRHQVFAALGMTDPDMAAADETRALFREIAESPSVVDDAPDNLIALDPPRNEAARG